MTKEKFMAETNKPVFTMRHYNRIHALIKKQINEHKKDCTLKNGIPVSENDLYFLIGMERLHDELGNMFKKDNPKFKPELWQL